jgi:hypothetical protein
MAALITSRTVGFLLGLGLNAAEHDELVSTLTVFDAVDSPDEVPNMYLLASNAGDKLYKIRQPLLTHLVFSNEHNKIVVVHIRRTEAEKS